MTRLKILIWHVHGSYLNALTRVEHDWYLPVRADRASGYIGKGETFDHPDWVHEVPAERIRDLDLDLIIFQSPRNLEIDQYEILSLEQQALPRIYIEHNTPRPHPVDTRHPVTDPRTLLVHVTPFNRLMWDNGDVPTAVIEHSVAIDPGAEYRGRLERGITVINGPQRRPRIAGFDLFLRARERIPLDIAGMETEEFGGLGDIPYRHLHRRVAEYRFLYSPMRYTSLPLAVIEAMTLGMPVVALPTTELPSVIEHGRSGFLSCELEEQVEYMRYLIAHPDQARAMGTRARETAERRFGLDRFARDWNAAFGRSIALNRERSADANRSPAGAGAGPS
jgi:hypothetical protein